MSDLIQVHSSRLLALPGGGEADIDLDMVPLVQRLWALKLETTGCCQDFGESIESNGHRSPTSDHDRQRHADFYRGQAWLKMPTGDATALTALLGTHPVFRERMRRWTHPESWMSIVYIFPTDQGADLADAAQIHFPRAQIPELTAALAGFEALRPFPQGAGRAAGSGPLVSRRGP
jgi:hypothetical protein